MLLTQRCRRAQIYTGVIPALRPSIQSAFAHTRCISPSVCLLKSLMQASTFAPSPLTARASAIRSRTCGRQRLAFLAVSATGGARKPNPSEGGEGAPAPRAEINCFGKEDSNERNPSGVSFVLVQLSFALQRRGEGAPAPCSDLLLRAAPLPAPTLSTDH